MEERNICEIADDMSSEEYKHYIYEMIESINNIIILKKIYVYVMKYFVR